MSNERWMVLPALLALTLAHAAFLPTRLSVTSTCHQATGDAYAHTDLIPRYQQAVLGGIYTGPLGSVYAYCHQNALALLPSPDLSALSMHTLTFTLPATDQSGSWRAALELHDAQGHTVLLLQPVSNTAQDGALTFVFNLPVTAKVSGADLLLNRGSGIERAHLR